MKLKHEAGKRAQFFTNHYAVEHVSLPATVARASSTLRGFAGTTTEKHDYQPEIQNMLYQKNFEPANRLQIRGKSSIIKNYP